MIISRTFSTEDTDTNRSFKEDITAIILFFVAALIFRLIRLFDLDVWFDEVVLLLIVNKSFAEIWSFCQVENFPPLYPWLIKIWSYFSSGENSIRLFSALLGSLTPPAAFILGRMLLGKKYGILLGILCVISPPLLYYSQMIRMYSPFSFLACLSLIGFFKGIKTNRWRYWILMSAANLLGFYLFVFMSFLIIWEAIILLALSVRKDFNRSIRSAVAHLPTLILISLWVIPLLSRYQSFEGSFWLEPVSFKYVGELWFLLGSGTDFYNRYTLAVIINLPCLLGIVFCLKNCWEKLPFRVLTLLFFGIILTVLVISLSGASIFFKRYFMFLIPVYLMLVLAGWMSIKRVSWRNIGIGLTFASIILSMSYYYLKYFEFHNEYLFALSRSDVYPDDGHAITKTALLIENEIASDEVIIHYSGPTKRSFTFFPCLFYHERKHPEFIYSAEPIPDHFGGQYLQPGDRIRSLKDLSPTPEGIWVVSLDLVEVTFDTSDAIRKIRGWQQSRNENLPKELYDHGFTAIDTIRFGGTTTLHFRRNG